MAHDFRDRHFEKFARVAPVVFRQPIGIENQEIGPA
jgi:hypothetical protein